MEEAAVPGVALEDDLAGDEGGVGEFAGGGEAEFLGFFDGVGADAHARGGGDAEAVRE